MKLFKLFTLSLLALSGCQSAPYAVIDGGNKVVTDPNSYDVKIKAIDGQMLFKNNIRKNIEPGQHIVVLETTKKHKGQSSTQDAFFVIDAKPCEKYRVSAQHGNMLSKNWEVKLIETTKIPSCVVDEDNS